MSALVAIGVPDDRSPFGIIAQAAKQQRDFSFMLVAWRCVDAKPDQAGSVQSARSVPPAVRPLADGPNPQW